MLLHQTESTQTQRRIVMKKTYYFFAAAAALVLLMSAPELLQAQPPGLPGAPDQAPLGGLGLLAAAGGAYAWNKLRNKNHQG